MICQYYLFYTTVHLWQRLLNFYLIVNRNKFFLLCHDSKGKHPVLPSKPAFSYSVSRGLQKFHIPEAPRNSKYTPVYTLYNKYSCTCDTTCLLLLLLLLLGCIGTIVLYHSLSAVLAFPHNAYLCALSHWAHLRFRFISFISMSPFQLCTIQYHSSGLRVVKQSVQSKWINKNNILFAHS